MREQRARLRRLSIWFCINLIIFVACYLNYRLQLKHRYLYRTLNVGLCFSRAAAMIINFNLLLVWLPMCKYSLTRLAFHANNLLNRLKCEQQERQKKNLNNEVTSMPSSVLVDLPITKQNQSNLNNQYYGLYRAKKQTQFSRFERKFRQSLADSFDQLKSWLCMAKLNFINSFLIAVDHCTPLHTICATTITIASVIHTVAHLMNVINFSKNYDPLLSNLNMAEYKGQNPLQLLVSVPGITGCLMVIILILMSLSSTDMIRNSSYDLFQIFHRLSIIFVFLLFVHPSSHVLKEQSNVERHHPELCNISGMTSFASMNSIRAMTIQQLEASSEQTNTVTWPRQTLSSRQSTRPPLSAFPTLATSVSGSVPNRTTAHQGHPNKSSAISSSASTSATHQHYHNNFVNNNKTDLSNHYSADNIIQVRRSASPLQAANNNNKIGGNQIDKSYNMSELVKGFDLNEPTRDRLLCLDLAPIFVAQSSICWYVLSIGLSCYLFDLILRKWRRSKSSIQLLDVRLDGEGNLIELILSNNHKRFSQWLPGQFVYLNCPQLAAFEWHPFTISSMDNRTRQFTLHIKTGGDWTKKLREKLELRQDNGKNSISAEIDGHCYSISSPVEFKQSGATSYPSINNCNNDFNGPLANFGRITKCGSLDMMSPIHIGTVLPNLDCYNRTGKLKIQCTKVCQIESDNAYDDNQSLEKQQYFYCKEGKIENDLHERLRSVVCEQPRKHSLESDELNLYIDGPFHSPFERLLEQQVSVCIANGVGWTAFSSTFQFITNNYSHQVKKDASRTVASQANSDWWWKWRDFAISKPTTNLEKMNGQQQARIIRKLSGAKLHIMVIVTSIEQLRPFYELAKNYFNRIQDDCRASGAADSLNPIKEITAFITRSTKEDVNVRKFCEQEKLLLFDSDQHHDQIIRVNEVFTIEMGKPNFESFLNTFNVIYPGSQKVSVYCCGSQQVKKTVKNICQHLNKTNKRCFSKGRLVYSYNEENF